MHRIIDKPQLEHCLLVLFLDCPELRGLRCTCPAVLCCHSSWCWQDYTPASDRASSTDDLDPYCMKKAETRTFLSIDSPPQPESEGILPSCLRGEGISLLVSLPLSDMPSVFCFFLLACDTLPFLPRTSPGMFLVLSSPLGSPTCSLPSHLSLSTLFCEDWMILAESLLNIYLISISIKL